VTSEFHSVLRGNNIWSTGLEGLFGGRSRARQWNMTPSLADAALGGIYLHRRITHCHDRLDDKVKSDINPGTDTQDGCYLFDGINIIQEFTLPPPV